MKLSAVVQLIAAALIITPTIAVHATEWTNPSASALAIELATENAGQIKVVETDPEWDTVVYTSQSCDKANFERISRWLKDEAPSRANYVDLSFRGEQPSHHRIRSMGLHASTYYVLVKCEQQLITVKAKNIKTNK